MAWWSAGLPEQLVMKKRSQFNNFLSSRRKRAKFEEQALQCERAAELFHVPGQ